MNGTVNYLYLIFFIMILGVVFFAIFYFSKNNPAPVPVATVPATFSRDAYPLYPQLTWSPQENDTEAIGTTTVSGLKVISNPIKNVTNISKEEQPFESYYDQKLTAAGWKRDISLQADGAGSSEWVYEKGKQIIIFSYESTGSNSDGPLTCPCDMIFSIFSGSL